MTTREIRAPEAPLSTLRGAGVDVDVRKVGRVIVGIALVGLAVLVLVLFVAGVQKNSQITRLQQQGVPVEVTVSGCLGEMGGSGSNLVGYSCSGSFALDGHRYDEGIPGNTFRAPGSRFKAVAVPGDPALVAPAAAVATEHTSLGVFILPAVLFVVLAAGVAAVVLRRQHLRA